MKIAALLPLALLAACSDAGEPAKQPAEAPKAVAGRGLTGLYEAAATGAAKSQMCVIERDGKAQFGFVVWGANAHSCSGTGTATQGEAGLKLAMAGDSECTIDAGFAAGVITFPAAIPDGCAYYCGARAKMNGATLIRVGNAEADALKATDLVGDPLCQGM